MQNGISGHHGGCCGGANVGGRVLVEPEPGETRYYYMQRVRQIAAAIKAAEDVEL